MKRFLLVDGSSVFYRAFYAMPPLSSRDGTPTNAVAGFSNILLKFIAEMNPTAVGIALDVGKKNFRNDLFSDYKPTA